MNLFTSLKLKKNPITLLLLSSLLVTNPLMANEKDHDHAQENHAEKKHDDGKNGEEKHEGEHGEESNNIALSNSQLQLADIQVTSLQPTVMTYSVYAPGEIKANDYTSYLVSPRVDSIVLKRHVALGDHVQKGEVLVTLFSETVAEAQAELLSAYAEWQRVQKLGRKAVGDKRYLNAKIDYQADIGRLLAFGLSQQAIDTLIKNQQQTSKKLGEYNLTAIKDGAVLSDHFRQGQRVEAGNTLIELADESQLWVEARLAPTMKLNLPVGSKATVTVGSEQYVAIVSQKAHTIDPQTRTRTVRLTVNNPEHQLHSGLFVDVYFNFDTNEKVLAVPENALMRSEDGDWQVFIEHDGKFTAQEINLGRSFMRANSTNKWREISGIDAGSRVVTQGAFYVSSELAKSGFDAHGH